MANFCINCGTKVKKGDKFCSNCGTKIINDDNFCIHCGGEIRDGDKFCIHCGTKIDKFHIKSNNSLEDSIENNGITQKEELVKRKFEVIDELYESEEIQTLIRENNLFEYEIGYIKIKLRKMVRANNKISADELKDYLKNELNKVIEDKRKRKEKLMGTNTASGGYCGLDCVHYCTEYLSYDEGVVGDFGVGDYCEYYCSFGHSIYEGSYCKDFEFEGQWLFSR